MYRQQPSAGSASKRIEDYLGAVLCHRGPGGFQLTDHGTALSEVWDKIQAGIMLLPATFDEISGELMFQLRLMLVGNLVSRRLDTAIARFGQMYPRAELLFNVAPHSHMRTRSPLAGTTVNTLEQIADEAFVLPGTDEAEPVDIYRETSGLEKNLVAQSLNMNEVKRMATAGRGMALLAFEFMQTELDSDAIWSLMPPQKNLIDDIYVVTNPTNGRYLAVTGFPGLLPEE